MEAAGIEPDSPGGPKGAITRVAPSPGGGCEDRLHVRLVPLPLCSGSGWPACSRVACINSVVDWIRPICSEIVFMHPRGPRALGVRKLGNPCRGGAELAAG